MHAHNSFITLTYAPEHLPENGSISIRALQLFMKRVRKKYNYPIRFFACGEYGEELSRPHYHACLFGHDFKDRKFWQFTESGERLYRSAELESLWQFGYSTTGDVTFKSAAYVARYIMKKQNGRTAENHYQGKTPEFCTMSRGGKTGQGGIGTSWLQKYESDVYPGDFVVINQKKARPPRFYDNNIDPENLGKLKRKRKKSLRQHEENNTPERLAVREKILEKKNALLKRKMKEI